MLECYTGHNIAILHLNHANEWREGIIVNQLLTLSPSKQQMQIQTLINYIFTLGVDEGAYHSVNLPFSL